MAVSPGGEHTAPVLNGRGVLNEGSTNTHQMPRLIAPTPIHAGIPTLTPTSMDSLVPVQSNIEEEPQLAISSPKQTPSLRTRTDVDAILPIQGGEQDALAAIEKLEKIERTLHSKRMWLRGSGVEGMAKVATAGGKKRLKQAKNGVMTQDNESVSSLPRYGEVKLGISSLPGYPVMAAQKARQFLNRSHPVTEVTGDGKEKDRSSMESAGDESVSRFQSLSLRKPRPIRHRPMERNSSRNLESEEVLMDVHQGQPSALPFSAIVGGPASPPRSAAAKTDLPSVEEHVPVKDQLESPDAVAAQDESPKAIADKRKQHERPRLMVQTPSDNGILLPPFDVPKSQTKPSSKPSSLRCSPGSPENCDEKAQAVAEVCQDHIANPSTLSPGEEAMYDSPSSSTSDSENEEGGFASDSENSSIGTTPLEECMLNLEHGEELTKKQRKQLLRRIRKSKTQRVGDQDTLRREPSVLQKRRQVNRAGSLSSKVQVGLHYATSQSRNRRAMERYSPHPSRPNSAAPLSPKTDLAGNLADMLGQSRSTFSTNPLGDISRSSTPGNVNVRDSGADSRRSSMSMSEKDRVLAGGAQMGEGGFCLSPIVDDNMDREDRWAELIKNHPRRQNTANSLTSTTTGNVSFRKRYFSLRRKRQDTFDLAEESDSGQNTPKGDPDKELDSMLGKLAAQQAPEQLKELFEYDVLYENQRGLMFFGIPKFSAKTLFQWDPASWTNAYNEDSAYNVVNAQLPDPSWEWVHPEWMIDMTGDVDESGWQYSYNFGRFSLNILTRPTTGFPRAGVEGNAIMNERMKKKHEKRLERENNRADDGFEALKRTARTRGARWTGIPDQNKYVRRRRWIRLRMRKPLVFTGTTANTPATGTPLGFGKASGDWSHLLKEEEKRRAQEQAGAEDDASSSSSSSSDADSISNLESDEADSTPEYASEGAGSSTFLPRRTPGNLRNGPNNTELKAGKERERLRRHAKEFTGTIRELKTLLPAILDRHQQRRPTNRQRVETELWLSDIDARNPFISWNLVKKRLDDDDLAFATASLRARERRHAEREWERKAKTAESRGIDPSLEPEAASHRFDLSKDAVVELNYRRVMRVMRACKVDRHKLQLWKIWLGVEPISSITEVAREEDLSSVGLGINSNRASETMSREKKDALRQARAQWRKAFSHPEAMDIWDLLERRLDRLLLTFEYQGSRASLLRLLLTIHATSHWPHRYRQTHWSVETGNGQTVEPDAPSTLSPQFGVSEWLNMSIKQGNTPAGDEWRAVRLPRLEFWSDLEKCARALLESSQTITASPPTAERGSPSIHGGASPHLTLNRNSPVPSIGRSSTPQLMGSLANGPTTRRMSQPTLAPPAIRPSSKAAFPSFSPSQTETTIRGDITTFRDRDQTFLASLLQLPRESQQELLIKTAEQNGSIERCSQQPSSVIRRLTRAVEEDSDEDE